MRAEGGGVDCRLYVFLRIFFFLLFFFVGKKNWQISATKNGAEASGILYSIAETARANGLRPYYYFKHVLETMIPHMDDKTTDFLEKLMPWSESLPEVCRSKEK